MSLLVQPTQRVTNPTEPSPTSLDDWLRVCRERYVALETNYSNGGGERSPSLTTSSALDFVSTALSATRRLQMKHMRATSSSGADAAATASARSVAEIHDALKATLELVAVPTTCDLTPAERSQWITGRMDGGGCTAAVLIRGAKLWLQCHATYAEALAEVATMQRRIEPYLHSLEQQQQQSCLAAPPSQSSSSATVSSQLLAGLEQLFPCGGSLGWGTDVSARRAAVRTRIATTPAAVTSPTAPPASSQGAAADATTTGPNNNQAAAVIVSSNPSLWDRVQRWWLLHVEVHPYRRALMWSTLTVLMVRLVLWLWARRVGAANGVPRLGPASRSASFSL